MVALPIDSEYLDSVISPRRFCETEVIVTGYRRRQAREAEGRAKLSFDMSKTTLHEVDEIAREEGLSRAAIISRLIDKGLEAERQGAAA